jgi:hypothetical protein
VWASAAHGQGATSTFGAMVAATFAGFVGNVQFNGNGAVVQSCTNHSFSLFRLIHSWARGLPGSRSSIDIIHALCSGPRGLHTSIYPLQSATASITPFSLISRFSKSHWMHCVCLWWLCVDVSVTIMSFGGKTPLLLGHLSCHRFLSTAKAGPKGSQSSTLAESTFGTSLNSTSTSAMQQAL